VLHALPGDGRPRSRVRARSVCRAACAQNAQNCMCAELHATDPERDSAIAAFCSPHAFACVRVSFRDPWIGFKTAQSSQVGVTSLRPASSSSSSSSIVRAKVAASGQFSWYHDRAALKVGARVAPVGAGSFTSIQVGEGGQERWGAGSRVGLSLRTHWGLVSWGVRCAFALRWLVD
jgi:hypothetical protein